MVVIAWKKLLVAGVTGLACGKGYIWLRQYPDTVRPILYCSALSGACGVAMGMGVAVYRDLPSHVYALSTGANFALVTATFLSIRHILLRSGAGSTHLTQRQTEVVSSGTSGGIAATMATILSKRGFRSCVVSGCVGVGLGLLTQLLYIQLEQWRIKKAVEIHFPDLTRGQETEESVWKRFEARFMKYWHSRSKAIQTDTDIVVFTESIKMERLRLEQLDQLLTDKGTASTTNETVPVINTESKTLPSHSTNTLSIQNSDLKMPQTR